MTIPRTTIGETVRSQLIHSTEPGAGAVRMRVTWMAGSGEASGCKQEIGRKSVCAVVEPHASVGSLHRWEVRGLHRGQMKPERIRI